MSMTISRAAWIAFMLVSVLGCGSEGSSEPAPPKLLAEYHERVGDIHRMVFVDFDTGKVSALRGQTLNHLENASATCTATEQATGKRLLAEAIWETYERADSSAWGHGDADGAGGAGGAGDGGTGSWETDDDLPARLVAVRRSVDGVSGTKIFAGDSTGPESELIEYLRQLYEKYGQFE